MGQRTQRVLSSSTSSVLGRNDDLYVLPEESNYMGLMGRGKSNTAAMQKRRQAHNLNNSVR